MNRRRPAPLDRLLDWMAARERRRLSAALCRCAHPAYMHEEQVGGCRVGWVWGAGVGWHPVMKFCFCAAHSPAGRGPTREQLHP